MLPNIIPNSSSAEMNVVFKTFTARTLRAAGLDLVTYLNEQHMNQIFKIGVSVYK